MTYHMVTEIEVTAEQQARINDLHGGKPRRVGGKMVLTEPIMPLEEAVSAVTGIPLATLQLTNFKLVLKHPRGRGMVQVVKQTPWKGRI